MIPQRNLTEAMYRGPRERKKISTAVTKSFSPTNYDSHSLTAALDQLRVVASSTSNDPGPRSRQHQQIGQRLLPLAAADCTREVYILSLVERLSLC